VRGRGSLKERSESREGRKTETVELTFFFLPSFPSLFFPPRFLQTIQPSPPIPQRNLRLLFLNHQPQLHHQNLYHQTHHRPRPPPSSQPSSSSTPRQTLSFFLHHPGYRRRRLPLCQPHHPLEVAQPGSLRSWTVGEQESSE